MAQTGTNKPTSTAAPAAAPPKSTVPGVAKYLDQSRTLITITTIGDTEAFHGNKGMKAGSLSVQGIISAEYSFSVKNEFEALLKASSAITEFTKGANTFNQLIYDTGLSVVPYSPMIWMGANPLSVSELLLHFVCYDDAKNDVHLPLMRLLAMSLPQGKGVALQGVELGMLKAPPAVEIKIGEVIKWSPCFIENVVVTEKAPYTKEGYGMTGEAKVTIIRRDYIFAEDFNTNSLDPKAKEVGTNPVKK